MSWMDLVHQMDALTRDPASGYPSVVMVQPTQDWKSEHFASCPLRGRNQSALLGDLLPNPLMRSCRVEVGHVRIQYALELSLLQDQQVIQAFLTHTSQEAFTDGIGSGSVNGGFEYLDAAGCGHARETGAKFGIIIPNQVLGCVSIWGGFP